MTIQQALELAVQNHRAGRLREAEQIYRRILARQPNHADSHNLLGLVADEDGRHETALELFQKAIALAPTRAAFHCNLAIALQGLGQTDRAIAIYRTAIQLKPDYAAAHYNLGNALWSQGLVDQAIDSFRVTVKFSPLHAEAHNNLGFALRERGQVDQAIAAFRTAVQLKPDYAEAHYNLGNALRGEHLLDQAVDAYRTAIQLQPRLTEAQNNLANALKDQGQLDQAIAAYRIAIELRPDDAQAHSNYILGLHFHPGYDASAITEEARRWNQRHAEPLRKLIQPHFNDRNPQRRLRIGYVSSDFRNHPVGRFMLPLLSHHDKAQVEVFAYSQHAVMDAITERLRPHVDGWRSIAGLSDAQVADLIRADQIDILVDLTMHTALNRLLVFARKPAPVQVAWLGYPGGTGLTAIDYRLSDAYLDPPGMDESIYSEQTIRLPGCFWCYDPVEARDTPINSLPALSHRIVTFGCLSQFAKINDPLLALWAAVLLQVKDSRLLLLTDPGSHVQRTAAQLSQHGIDPGRLDFIPRRAHREYMEQYHRIDLALDSLPYNGHTTTFDGLWMGVPTVSMTGKTAVGRAGLSILSNLGLPELVGDCEQAYVQIAIELAQNLPRLSELRSTLRQRMERSPLMDAPRFAEFIEAAYRDMWQRWCETQR